MSSFNKVILMGNLTRDPQLKILPSQMAVCEFGIALNRKYRTAGGEDREDVVFVDVAAFGKTGEVIDQHFQKGKQILIEGRLKFDQWEDKNGGGKRSKLTVVADRFEFVGGPRDDGGGDDGDQRPRQQSRPAPSQRPQRETAGSPIGNKQVFKEDDIPFAWSGRDTRPL